MKVAEWQGWLALASLVVVFGVLTWWLLLSPLPAQTRPRRPAGGARLRVAYLVLLSGVLFSMGARWDELWHRLYGGFGDDFLWPPHLLLYGGLGLNAAFAGWGLGVALRGRGGLRARFRAEPLMGLLGLIATYQMASIPSDLLWHAIIGPDITAWSLPHLLLAVTTSGVWMAGIGLAISARPAASGWQQGGRPDRYQLVALGLAALGLLALLQIGVTEWEWPDDPGTVAALGSRPAWAYPVVVLAIGAVASHVALYATRWIGAATSVSLLALLGQVATWAIDRTVLPPGPLVLSALLLVPPAVALDLWLALGARRASRPTAGRARWALGGAALYAGVFLLDWWLTRSGTLLPATQPGLSPDVVAWGLASSLPLGWALASVGTWLASRAATAARGPAQAR